MNKHYIQLKWLLLLSVCFLKSLSLFSQCSKTDSLALVAFFDATNGQNWVDKTNWKQIGQPIKQWFGVSVNSQGCVTSIKLPENNLTGVLSHLDLPELISLVLNNNQLSGNIPNFSSSKLVSIYLQQNKFSGEIPNFNLPNLQNLYIQYNQLTGNVPNFNLPKLQYCYISNNRLTGILPSFNMPNLIYFYADNNQLVGNLPHFNFPKLNILSVFNNQLSGTIPYFDFPNLLYLQLNNNKFSGNLPPFNLPNLRYFYLQHNNLTGSIPEMNLPKLEELYINSNNLSGFMPDFPYSKLRYIYLDSNQLEGPIPPLNLPNLKVLALYNNKLSGHIPLMNSPKLEFLQLNNNQLSGIIPNLDLPFLNYCDIKDNRFTFDGVLSPIQGGTKKVVDYNLYAPQDSIFKDTLITAVLEEDIIVDLEIDPAIGSNNYKWFKNNQFYKDTNTNKLVIKQFKGSDTGIYTCQVTNPNAPNLTLYSRKIIIGCALNGLDKIYDLIICKGENGTVLDKSFNSNSTEPRQLIYSWMPTTGLSCSDCAKPLANPISSTTYVVSILDNYKCAHKDTIYINVAEKALTTLNKSICEGDTYILPKGRVASIEGVYIDTLKTFLGCDSIITTNLKVNDVTTENVSKTICQGEYLKLPKGSLVNTEGVYRDTLQNIWGCDSIIVTNLKVNPVSKKTLSVNICEGEKYKLPKGRFVETAGTYSDTLLNVFNCDSIVTTTIIVIPIIRQNLVQAICEGENYLLPKGRKVSIAGIYQDTFKNINNCDSIIITHLKVNPIQRTPLSINICRGQVFTLPKGRVVSTEGVYTDTLKTFLGCDSIITTNLKVNDVTTENVSKTICQGEYLKLPKGSLVNTEGVYRDTLQNIWGCDSIIVTNLKVNPVSTKTLSVNICEGEKYKLPKGNFVSNAGIYRDTFLNIFNCDSIITTELAIIPKTRDTIKVSICRQQPYKLPAGKWVTNAGIYRDTLKNSHNCDSIIITDLKIAQPPIEKVEQHICSGIFYRLSNGNVIIKGGLYRDTLAGSFGCDTILEITVIIDSLQAIKEDTLCEGQTYRLPSGRFVETIGTYKDVVIRKGQCDTFYTVILKKGCRPRVLVYNGLTPDNTENRYLIVENLTDFPQAQLYIYTRNNNLVFKSAIPYDNLWNGTDQNNSPLPADTYYYVLKLDSNEPPLQGYILLIR